MKDDHRFNCVFSLITTTLHYIWMWIIKTNWKNEAFTSSLKGNWGKPPLEGVLAWVLHCFVAYKTVVSAQALYSIGSDCARSVWEVDEIWIWQGDKFWHVIWKKGQGGAGGGVRSSDTEAKEGHALVKVKDGGYGQRQFHDMKGRTGTRRHIIEHHDWSREDHWGRPADQHSIFHYAWSPMTLETSTVKRKKK